MSTPEKTGGYNDREHLLGALRANTEMSDILLQLAQSNLPAVAALPLLRFSALLGTQARHLRDMERIRRADAKGQ